MWTNHHYTVIMIMEQKKKNNNMQLFKRYHFNDCIRQQVFKHTMSQNKNNIYGILLLLEDWSIIFLSIFCSKYVYNNKFDSYFILTIIIYLITVCIIGARQRGLADCLHAAAHNCFASNKYLNFFLGTFSSGYLIFQSFYGYQISHVRNHHPFLGTNRDPDYISLKENGIYGEQRTNSNIKKYLINLFTPKSSWNYLLYLIKYRIFTKDDNMYETFIRMIYLTGLLTFFFYTHNITNLLMFWFIPYLTSHMWIGSFIELLEHYPMIETAPRIDIYMSRNTISGKLWDFFFGVHNENYHLVHHLFPKVPQWELHSVHLILMQDPVYANLHQNPGWRNLLKDVLEVDDRSSMNL
ncbi:unnamed protein product [Rotaria sp. Silwood1]|nr:unnamed protein product [Rotaria sp. Silwood1]